MVVETCELTLFVLGLGAAKWLAEMLPVSGPRIMLTNPPQPF